MKRKRLGIAVATIMSVVLLPAGVGWAQGTEECMGPGDGSAVGAPSPCPSPTPGDVPSETPESPSSPEPDEAVVVSPPDDAEAGGQAAPLADTGIDAGALALGGVAALMVGAMAVIASRRRRQP